MKYYPNHWFDHSELIRAITVIRDVINKEPTRWLVINDFSCKYVQIRIDQRTGNFVILDEDGHTLPLEIVYQLYPELKDEGE